MSRAFVKENDLEHAGIDIPERPVSNETNYVTSNGFKELQEKLNSLDSERQLLKELESSNSKQKKLRIERDLRYFSSRLKSAILVDPSNQDKNIVLFSAIVEVLSSKNKKYKFEIVGEDEADVPAGKISVVSPIARAVMGKSEGDEIVVKAPVGDINYEIETVMHL